MSIAAGGENAIKQENLILSPISCSAARGILLLSRRALAAEAGVSLRTVTRYELEGAASRTMTQFKLQRALERYGVVFGNDGCSISWPAELLEGE